MQRITTERSECVAQIFKSNIATLQADDDTTCSAIALLMLYKHFSAPKYSWLRRNCEAGKNRVIKGALHERPRCLAAGVFILKEKKRYAGPAFFISAGTIRLSRRAS